MTTTTSKLWQPLKVGNATLSHRLVMAPLTRYRNDDDHVPLDIMVQYYADRASAPGTLIISEATGVSKAAEASPNLPSIRSPEQAAGWKKVYDAVHAKRSFMFQQLWDLGRAGDPAYLKSRGQKYSSSSNRQLDGKPEPPQPLTEEEIWEKVNDFRTAARNAIDAGADGVEVHGAHGYLLDQFTRDSVNDRTDQWGGSVENRARFLLEVVKAVTEEVGADKVGLRLSPFTTFQQSYSSDTWAQTGYILDQLKARNHKLAYVSLVEYRGDPLFFRARPEDVPEEVKAAEAKHRLEYFLEKWDNFSPVIVAGGYTPETIERAIDEKYAKWDVAIAFGRLFISNPDLVVRIKTGRELSPYDRKTFYLHKSNEGYNDYPFSQPVTARI